jgi:hypothetical protein
MLKTWENFYITKNISNKKFFVIRNSSKLYLYLLLMPWRK